MGGIRQRPRWLDYLGFYGEQVSVQLHLWRRFVFEWFYSQFCPRRYNIFVAVSADAHFDVNASFFATNLLYSFTFDKIDHPAKHPSLPRAHLTPPTHLAWSKNLSILYKQIKTAHRLVIHQKNAISPIVKSTLKIYTQF